ncbi:MAG TPA: flagellar hook protein FlgE [Caulobacteraceae bacterium]|jgi:flagellar hook protein FlgE
MSINSALLAGVTGLNANSTALAAISDNIANANTIGYKRVGVAFSSLVSPSATANSYSAGGVTSVARQFVSQQGTLQASASATDLAIAGDGFFVTTDSPVGVTAGDPRYFTRAGSFALDRNGYLMNSAGLYLQGWPADANGEVTADSANLNALKAINLLDIASTAQPTSTARILANLNADQTVSAQEATYGPGGMAAYAADPTTGVKPDFSIQVPVADSKGGQRMIVLDFLKSDVANQWHVEVRSDPPENVTGATDGLIASSDIQFDANGAIDPTSLAFLTNVSVGASDPAGTGVRWADGLGIGAQDVTFDLAKVTQLSSVSSVSSVQANGTAFGSLAGVSVDEDGFVTAVYENGTTRRLAQVAIATFPNADGLASSKGNSWQASVNSGGFTLKTPGAAGAGKISPSSLEASTVDLSSEFTGLITTQRAYSASSKIITTADQMLEELLSIKR